VLLVLKFVGTVGATRGFIARIICLFHLFLLP